MNKYMSKKNAKEMNGGVLENWNRVEYSMA